MPSTTLPAQLNERIAHDARRLRWTRAIDDSIGPIWIMTALAATVFLALRAIAGISWPWLLLAMPAFAGLLLARALRGTASLSQEQAAAMFDRESHSQGLLLTLLEVSDPAWLSHLERNPGLDTAVRPELPWRRWGLQLVPALSLLVALWLLPPIERMILPYQTAVAAATIEELEALADELEELEVLSPERQERLAEEIRSLANQRTEPWSSDEWLAADLLAAQLTAEAAEAQRQLDQAHHQLGSLADQLENGSALGESTRMDIDDLENLLSSGAVGGSPVAKETLESLKGLSASRTGMPGGKHPAASPSEQQSRAAEQSQVLDVSRSARNDGSNRTSIPVSASTAASLASLDPTERAQVARELRQAEQRAAKACQAIGERLGKGECNGSGACPNGGQCNGGGCQGGSQCAGQKPGAGGLAAAGAAGAPQPTASQSAGVSSQVASGSPGRGGINRGRGDAQLELYSESNDLQVRLKDVELEPSAGSEPGELQSIRLGEGGDEGEVPEVSDVPVEAAAARSATSRGAPLSRRARDIAERYFNRDR
ncbi:MAG: hypothetical protein RL885_11440 [Planctomycetota bacterium]